MSAIYRYEVPVDGGAHSFKLFGQIVHVETRNLKVVEFWAMHSDGETDGVVRTFTVVGTGHALPPGARYVGTAVVRPEPTFGIDPGLVWHLIEVA